MKTKPDAEILRLNKHSEALSKKIALLKQEIQKVIVGQEEIIDLVLVAMASSGHVLLEGVPGLAKTLLLKSLADAIGGSFSRIQFTPDLLPADIVGTKIFDFKSSRFSTKLGPVFSNFVLADEINRAPPKVQSALLEAMQEKQVTISGDTKALPKPFLVMATENPIETEGTYKLPEAQVDRFMMKLLLNYPSKKEEKEIIRRMTKGANPRTGLILSTKDVLAIQSFVPSVYAGEEIEEYISSIVDATRHPESYGLELKGFIDYGASPRASIWLMVGAKASAMINGRGFVLPEDVRAVAMPVLRHRVMLSFEAEAEGKTPDEVVEEIISKVPVP